jgi:hypothetical protein
MYENRYPKIQAASLDWEVIEKRKHSDSCYDYRVKVTYEDGGTTQNDEVEIRTICCDPETGFSNPSGEWLVHPVVHTGD